MISILPGSFFAAESEKNTPPKRSMQVEDLDCVAAMMMKFTEMSDLTFHHWNQTVMHKVGYPIQESERKEQILRAISLRYGHDFVLALSFSNFDRLAFTVLVSS